MTELLVQFGEVSEEVKPPLVGGPGGILILLDIVLVKDGVVEGKGAVFELGARIASLGKSMNGYLLWFAM